MRQESLSYRSHIGQRRDQRFLVAGDVRVAENGQKLLLRIAWLRGIDLRAMQKLSLEEPVGFLGGRPHDDRQQTHEVIGEKARIAADLQLADAVLLPDLSGLVRQFLLEDLLLQERGVLIQQLRLQPARVVVFQLRVFPIRAEI